jgi:hypothetical protein
MARRGKKNKRSVITRWREWREEQRASGAARRWRWGFATVALIAGAIGVAYGMHALERDVLRAQSARGPARITFVQRPAGMEQVTQSALAHFADVPWSSPTICGDIAAALAATGWVRDIEYVHRFPDRRIEIACDFRKPVAMVQAAGGWCLVDQDCVRLPGWYVNDPSYLLVVGVAQPPPAPGNVWPGDDLRAGIDLVELLEREHFRDQLTGVLVDNFGGRRDPHQPQIRLATDRAGGRIIWGSPVGQEVEENTVAQKLNLLRGNYQRFGRVDGDRMLLDVSVHPDRVIAPAHAGSAADGRDDTYAGM